MDIFLLARLYRCSSLTTDQNQHHLKVCRRLFAKYWASNSEVLLLTVVSMMPRTSFFNVAIISILLHVCSPFLTSHLHYGGCWSSSTILKETNSANAAEISPLSDLRFIASGGAFLSDLGASGDSRTESARIEALNYESNRISYNKELQNLLQRGQLSEVTEKLQKLKDQEAQMHADTIHILFSDSFARKNASKVEELYKQYFKSKALTPTSRTLNILMEGFRMLRDEVKVYYYRDCFEYYDIPMDSYSYSSLIRTTRSPSTIKNILHAAEKGKSLSPPLVRCAIESLGKLGDPQGAVAVASRLCTKNDAIQNSNTERRSNDVGQLDSYYSRRIFDSGASGDSLLVALLENPQLYLVSGTQTREGDGNTIRDAEASNQRDSIMNGFGVKSDAGSGEGEDEDGTLKDTDAVNLERRVHGMQCGEAALHLLLTPTLPSSLSAILSVGDEIRADFPKKSARTVSTTSTEVVLEDPQRDVLVCGSKGWCRVFTFLQRSIKEALEEKQENRSYGTNNKMKGRYEASKVRVKKLMETRDSLWQRLSVELMEIEAKMEERNKRLDAEREKQLGDSVVLDDAVKEVQLVDSSSHASAPVVTTIPPSTSSGAGASVSSTGGGGGGGEGVSRGGLELNGRLSDALLRCYLDDAEKAKKMWKSNVLPIAKRLTGYPARSSSFDEVCEKSLEALMFVSGYNGRADLGFEIALTVRNRNWNAASRSKLAKSYVQGKLQSSGRKAQWMQSNILNDGLERSIESELGVQLLDFYWSPEGSNASSPPPFKPRRQQWPQRIRIQF